MTELSEMLYPRCPYRGPFEPAHVVFNASLQRFSLQVGYICNLQTGGKLAPEAAYLELAALWEQLQRCHDELDIEAR